MHIWTTKKKFASMEKSKPKQDPNEIRRCSCARDNSESSATLFVFEKSRSSQITVPKGRPSCLAILICIYFMIFSHTKCVRSETIWPIRWHRPKDERSNVHFCWLFCLLCLCFFLLYRDVPEFLSCIVHSAYVDPHDAFMHVHKRSWSFRNLCMSVVLSLKFYFTFLDWGTSVFVFHHENVNMYLGFVKWVQYY